MPTRSNFNSRSDKELRSDLLSLNNLKIHLYWDVNIIMMTDVLKSQTVQNELVQDWLGKFAVKMNVMWQHNFLNWNFYLTIHKYFQLILFVCRKTCSSSMWCVIIFLVLLLAFFKHMSFFSCYLFVFLCSPYGHRRRVWTL